MSDLIYFFGNNDEVPSLSNNLHADIPVKNVKKPQRPGTLKVRKDSSSNKLKQKQLKSSDSNNGTIYNHINSFPLTPANISTKLFDIYFNNSVPMHNSMSCSNLSNFPNELPPENADGNIEYKRQLLNLTPLRLQHLITQLKWRLAEGEGEAIYEIGVDDNGKVTGLEKMELMESVRNLIKMAETLNANVYILRECIIGSRRALEILIKKVPTYFSTNETRVAVLGNMDAGKSTLIGVLTQGVLDNGQGKTRLTTFRHVHEVRSGRTSSISCQLLGFDVDQNLLNFYWQKNRLHHRSHEELVMSSSKLVALIDLAGYHKYQRTTLFALTAKRPHLVLLVIPANQGFKGTAIDHCQFAIALGVPIAVVISKIDRCSSEEAIYQFSSWFQSRNYNFSISTISNIEGAKQAASNISIKSSIPVFPVSCVTGTGIEMLTTFLGTLQITEEISKNCKPEIWIDQMLYEVPRVEGCVVGGLLYTGIVKEKDCLYLGPQKDGGFVSVTVQSIHRNRFEQTSVENGRYASFALCLAENLLKRHTESNCQEIKWIPQSPSYSDDNQHSVCKGMVLLGSPPDQYNDYLYNDTSSENIFQEGHVAWGMVVNNISLLDDRNLTIEQLQKMPGSWIVHCGNVYHKCDILTMESTKTLRISLINDISPDDLIFSFKSFPQLIHGNFPVVFHRSGKIIKGCGTIKLLLNFEAFKKLNTVADNIGKTIVDHNYLSFYQHFTNTRTKFQNLQSLNSQSNVDSSDEYVTAPSSPILF